MDYNRTAAVAYAKRWAYGRNPVYYDFEGIGGDCTNFASQCVFAGAGVMNYRPVFGWYYRSLAARSPSWTGVEFFFNFLTTNQISGPYGVPSDGANILPGDIAQLGGIDGKFYHNLVVVSTAGGIRVAAHTLDAWDVPLESYRYFQKRFIHLEGVRNIK